MTQPTFAELLTLPGVEERSRLEGRVGFMAYHGGELEVMTDVIAEAAAERSGASCYSVRQPESVQIHISSTSVTADQSPVLEEFLSHVDIAITIHGFGRRSLFTTLLLGGRNRELAAHVASHLRPALPAYDVVDDLEQIPDELRGIHPSNPVNVPRLAGVQIELPPRVRGSSPIWRDWEGGLVPHTESLIGALAAAATTYTLPT